MTALTEMEKAPALHPFFFVSGFMEHFPSNMELTIQSRAVKPMTIKCISPNAIAGHLC